jgi:serine/threonine protein kinase
MDEAFHAGDVLRGRYEIQQLLRRARDKKVYLAHDQVLDCQVAVDVFTNNSIMPSGLTVSAWEARVLGQLGDNPNIATILDYWEDSETAVMVTRYLSGGSLRNLIERLHESGESLPVENILRLSTEIASALAYIHRRRILYRDLQPRNVLFDEWGTIHLVDFDTAVSLDDQDISDLPHRPVNNYMAPELIDGGNADERADLYSLGATIYEMCQGRLFTGNLKEILTAYRAGPSASLERNDLPETLQDLVFSLLAPNREQRPASAAEVIEFLDGIRIARVKRNTLITELLDVELATLIKLPRNTKFVALTKMPSEMDLSPDHRCLVQAIMALYETDHRRAAIDAGTATEVALALAISGELQAKGLNPKTIDLIIRMSNGLAALISLYTTFDLTLPISRGRVMDQLANIRNFAAHAGRIPSAEEATRAVEVARTLVSAVHPFGGRT